MMRVLIAKEWAGIRPFAWLLVVMVLLDLLEMGVGSLSDWHRSFTLFDQSLWTVDAVFSLLLAFAMGSGLLAREVEDGTLDFLDGLPVRRRDVFLAKLIVAGGCLFCYVLTTPILGWLVQLMLRHSLDVPVAPGALGWLALRYLLLVMAGLALGLLFGFVRYLAWALFAIAGAAIILLRSVQPRLGSAFDPTQLVADGWSTQGWGGDTVWTIGVLTLACLAITYLLFAGAGGSGMLRLARLAGNRALVLSLCAAACVTVALAVYHAQDSDDDVQGGAQEAKASGQPTTAAAKDVKPAALQNARKRVTAHYTFNIPAGRKVDEPALRAADAAFATAAAALAIDARDIARIDVDLSGSIAHTAGLAAHNRIRLNLDADWEDTLVHETVHVMAAWLAGGEHDRGLERMSLFNEGLAHWAEPSYRHSEGTRVREHMAVATLFRRHLLSQDALLDNRTLERQLDWQLQYPLGAALIDALVQRYGKDAPSRVLATLGDPDFPPDLQGYALYRSAFQLAGFDLNLVLNDYALTLGRWSTQFASAIDAAPRPRGLLVRADGQAGIAVQLDQPLGEGQRLVVLFKPRLDSPLDEVAVVDDLETSKRHGGRPVAWVPGQVAANQVCYQLGVRNRGYRMVEPWTCLPLRVAAD